MGQIDKKLKNELFKVAIDYIYKEHLVGSQGELADKIGISASALSRIMSNKKTVGDALKEHKLIDGEEGQFGLYVKTVNSVSYDYDKDGKYWAFYEENAYANQGVDQTPITEGRVYTFKPE